MELIDNNEKKKILKFLKNIGVDTRFVSVLDSCLLINNLRFSKFSKTKENLFKKSFPGFEVIRSKLFQKICTRSSRTLSNIINPREKILLKKENTLLNEFMFIILEPYTRKYGIQLVFYDFELNNLNVPFNYDSIALPLTLDDEVENILNCIFKGKQISLKNSKIHDKKLIYPLINVPLEWIYLYLDRTDLIYLNNKNTISHEFLIYLEKVVPQVRENILKSSQYLCE